MKRCLALFVLLGGSVALAEDRTPPSAELQSRMNGRFLLAEPRPVVETRLASVVESAVAPMSFMIRPIARSRISPIVYFCAEYALSLDASEVNVRCDTRPAVQRKLDGSDGPLRGLDGEPVQVKVELEPAAVSLRFATPNGERSTTYRFDDKDGMEITARITSSQMAAPLEWKIRYRRASQPNATSTPASARPDVP